ncbi:MAG: hypothetical protein MI866_03255 [Bacteroidales bacterium]|nr:hypothetical protein [Bacteroidales bacterium]
MSELFLDALMQIFALLTDQREEQKTGDGLIEVKNFLLRNLNKEFAEMALERYEHYTSEYHKDSYSQDQEVRDKQASTNMDRLTKICDQLNQELEQSEKYLLVANMLNFIMRDRHVSEEEGVFTDALARYLKLNENDYQNLRTFVLDYPLEVEDKERLLLISGQKESPRKTLNTYIILNSRFLSG